MYVFVFRCCILFFFLCAAHSIHIPGRGKIHFFSVTRVGNGKRCWEEEGAVLKAKHMVACGVTSRKKGEKNILASCVQSSSLRANPHEILVTIKSSGFHISCSCSSSHALGSLRVTCCVTARPCMYYSIALVTTEKGLPRNFWKISHGIHSTCITKYISC